MSKLLSIKEMNAQAANPVERDGKVVINEAKTPNQSAIQKAVWESPEMLAFRTSFAAKHGFDMADKKQFPVHEAGFSWDAVAKKMGAGSVSNALREAEVSSGFVQVLRAGVQNVVNQMYETVPTTFESWATVIQSKKDTEPYAPLHGISFLREVGQGEIYPESRAAGLDIKLKNRKYGTMFAVTKELLEDDQTGQFQRQAGLLGEYAKLAIEALVYAKLAGIAAEYGGMKIPATETQPTEESTYPWSTALVGGGSNRPASFGVFSQAALQSGIIALMNQKNKLGLKMAVEPKRIIVGPQDRFSAAILLNSSFYPSVPSSTAGVAGSSFSINPIQSIAALTVSRFLAKNDGTMNGDTKAWYLLDDSKPWFVAQIREAASVQQEAPNAGASFERDEIRFKLTMRMNADHIDPRFAFQGNDGSVTS